MSVTYILTVRPPPPLPIPLLLFSPIRPVSPPASVAVEVGRLWGDLGVDPGARENLLLVRRLSTEHQTLYMWKYLETCPTFSMIRQE